MVARVFLFFALVTGLVGVTAAVGGMIPEGEQVCENYKACSN